MATCPVCSGSTGSYGDNKFCQRCGGSGQGSMTDQACMGCGGSGQSSQREWNSCHNCSGTGHVADPTPKIPKPRKAEINSPKAPKGKATKKPVGQKPVADDGADNLISFIAAIAVSYLVWKYIYFSSAWLQQYALGVVLPITFVISYALVKVFKNLRKIAWFLVVGVIVFSIWNFAFRSK